jgi:HAD superfamily hydrolase (TIGR01450 family)
VTRATTIQTLIDRYDALLLDAYGVLVTAGGSLPGAAAVIQDLAARDIPYFVVTNDASRLPGAIAGRLQGLGLPVPAERALSSGALLTPYFQEHGLAGCRTAVLGPADSRAYVREAGGVVVEPSEAFDVLAVCDEHDTPLPDAVNQALSRAYAQLEGGTTPRLVLPNPDLIAPHGDGQFGFTAGALALLIEHGLALRYPDRDDLRFDALGKPQTPLFEEAMRLVASRNVVMIGDQLATDIAGANAAGIDSALITGGIATATIPVDGPQPTWLLPPLAEA